MARSKITPNPPPSSRNPLSQAHNPLRAPGASSSQVERPAAPRPDLAQATPPVAGGASVPSPNFKKLYLWATPTLLKETSSVNSAGTVLRLKKGEDPHLSFHKEHDDKMMDPKTRYPIVVRFNKVNYVNVSINNYANVVFQILGENGDERAKGEKTG
ncbi:photosystem I reaction center subunit IV, chloroplastic-like [Phaseolus vulgaris]|uniref:photosystem I reaction center subunit IV, chloroplastic-like n=1 Tax=Phaseolus vulgaris TaxID=3885 RepID=UPI0035CAAEE5